jgi:hypothetical protein
LSVTSAVPRDVFWMLRAISWVAAPSSSTAAAIALAMSLSSAIVAPMPRIAVTVWSVAS